MDPHLDGRWWAAKAVIPGVTETSPPRRYVYHARVYRHIGYWDAQVCTHDHYKRSGARRCAERWAAQLNGDAS